MIRYITRALSLALLRAKEDQARAQRAEGWLSTTLTSIGDAVIATDLEGNVVFMNPIAESLTQWSLAEAKNKPLTEVFNIVNQDTRQVVENPVSKVIEQNGIVGLANHTVVIGKHGKEAAIEDSAAPIRVSEGGPIQGVVLVFRDITEKYAQEKKLAESYQQLKLSEASVRSVLESALDAVVGMDDQGCITHWNPQAEKIFGFTAAEAVGRRMSETIIPHKYRQAHEQGMKHFLATGEGPMLNQRIEITALRRDGVEFPIELSITSVQSAGLTFFAAFIRDISEPQKLARDLQMKSEALENSLNGFDIVSADGVFLYANKAYLDMWGYDSLEEILGTSPAGHCTDPKTPEKIIGILKERGECDIEFVARRKDGSTFDVRMWARLAYGPDGNEIYPTTAIDITERKKSERAVKESEEQFRSLANSMSQLAWIADTNGWIYWYNERWYDYTGTTLEEMQGWGWQKVQHPDHLERVLEYVKEGWKRPEPMDITFPIRSKSGEWRWFLTRAVPIRDHNGKVIRWFGTNTDIQEQKETQEALVKASLEAMVTENALKEAVRSRDEFLSIASHELKTPLTSLTLQNQIRNRQIAKGKTAQFAPEVLPKIFESDLKQLLRLNRLIDDMLDIARIRTGKLELNREPVDLCEVTKDVVERLNPQIVESGCDVSFKFCEQTIIDGDAFRLEQAITNLIINAIKYGQGKPVAIEVGRDPRMAFFKITDQGMGISAQDQKRIFGRFERAVSASDVSGLGLGLAIANDIVAAHKGQILVESEIGKGSVFTIEIPLPGI